MTDETTLKKIMERFDEVWAHKEAVASSVLGDLGDKIHNVAIRADGLSKDIGKLELALHDAIRDIREDMKDKHKDIDYAVKDTTKRLSFVEKVLLAVASMIGMAFLGGLISMVFVK